MGFLWRFHPLLERKQPLAFAPSFSPLGILLGDLLEKRDNLLWVTAQYSFWQFEIHNVLTFHTSDWRDSCARIGAKGLPDRLKSCLWADSPSVNFPNPRTRHLKHYRLLASQLASLLPHWSRSALSTQQATPQSRTELCYCLPHKGIQVLGRKCVVNKFCFPLWCGGESWDFEVQREMDWCLALALTSCVSLSK